MLLTNDISKLMTLNVIVYKGTSLANNNKLVNKHRTYKSTGKYRVV